MIQVPKLVLTFATVRVVLIRVLKSALICANVAVGAFSIVLVALMLEDEHWLTPAGQAWADALDWLIGVWSIFTIAAFIWLSDLARCRRPWNWVLPVALLALCLLALVWPVWFATSPMNWVLTLSIVSVLVLAVVNGGRATWRSLALFTAAAAGFVVAFYWLAAHIAGEYYTPQGG